LKRSLWRWVALAAVGAIVAVLLGIRFAAVAARR